METTRGVRGAAESVCAIDMVIEDLDEFAVDRAGNCFCATNADYITQAMAPVAVG